MTENQVKPDSAPAVQWRPRSGGARPSGPGPARPTVVQHHMAPLYSVIDRVSPRQGEILNPVSLGFGDKEIAIELRMSTHTVRSHLSRLFLQHGLRTRAALVAAWLRGGSASSRS
jgi:DNA-binding NarL/FixJ family response regulator